MADSASMAYTAAKPPGEGGVSSLANRMTSGWLAGGTREALELSEAAVEPAERDAADEAFAITGRVLLAAEREAAEEDCPN